MTTKNNRKLTKIIPLAFGLVAIIAGMSVVPSLGQQEATAAINCPSGGGACYGTSGNDTIYGSANRDIILAGAGDDTIFGNGGDDNIYGEAGKDTISGGAGNDNLYHSGSASGSDGFADSLDGDSGSDTCHWNSSDGDTMANCTSIPW
ncbi:calcium-binding protein [Nitrosopumilus ureiphilus]|uniref:Calcium-binding protein n=1 Tax=Nitrosopumilus ureiphilus TaxID=1470067 RepID=A0A7D5RAP9_9ARCH|nr:hypothetical protein [Nitrosopumilus ureiphilus]QLH06664.1 hypothetical protein C5F50_05930 [Nitrosopumilus ureiphilus]